MISFFRQRIVTKYYLMKKAHYCLGFFFLLAIQVSSQSISKLDSLQLLYEESSPSNPGHLKILKRLTSAQEDPQRKLLFSQELIKVAQQLDSINYLLDGYIQQGNALRLKSDLTLALESYFQAANIAHEQQYEHRLGVINIAIADVYSIIGNHQNAINYYQQAITTLRNINDSLGLASALLNAGDEYFNQGRLDSAMLFFNESLALFNGLNHKIGAAYNQGNVGMIYAEQGKDDLAEKYMNDAILILVEKKDYYPISVYLTYISDIYLKRDDWTTALHYAQRSLTLSQRYGLKDQISDANLQISKLHEQVGNYQESFEAYKDYITYKDSFNNILSVQQMADLRTDYEIAQKQIEVDLLNQQRKTQRIIVSAVIGALFLIGLLALGMWRRYRYIKRTNKIIEKEKNRAEELLLNILPKETAQELKEFGKVKAHKFDSVTILFTDFEGFSFHSEKLSPEELVDGVDYYYSKFDEITERFGLEKIKTVGDSYMCAGGLPFPTKDHAIKMVQAAFEMAEFVRESKKDNQTGTGFDIRIGINTGPVVAGVVGTKKFAYDIWGDAVNIASRMENSSLPGKINVSQHTYEQIKDYFPCEYRGEIDVKNLGRMKMYFVLNSNDVHVEQLLS